MHAVSVRLAPVGEQDADEAELSASKEADVLHVVVYQRLQILLPLVREPPKGIQRQLKRVHLLYVHLFSLFHY